MPQISLYTTPQRVFGISGPEGNFRPLLFTVVTSLMNEQGFRMCVSLYRDLLINPGKGGGWMHHLFIYLFICWSNRKVSVALLPFYFSMHLQR